MKLELALTWCIYQQGKWALSLHQNMQIKPSAPNYNYIYIIMELSGGEEGPME